jgi:protein kinase A
MHALGSFLKKKRTREGNRSNPSNPPSQPASPITPTGDGSFDQIRASRVSHSSAASQTTGTPHSSFTSTTATRLSRPADEAAEKQQSMNSLPVQQPPYQVPQHSPSPGTTESQNVPRIANLINPPQHDVATGYQQHLGTHYSHQPSNNGGPQSSSMLLQHQQFQNHFQQQQPPQPQPPQEQVRVTKGKYSLADFELLRTLGTGSFGRVHLVQSRHNSRFYAIKVLKKAQVVKMKQVEHTNDERRMLGEVKHPFLITLWGTFQDAKNLYMVMDFVEGGELFSLLRKSGVSKEGVV